MRTRRTIAATAGLATLGLAVLTACGSSTVGNGSPSAVVSSVGSSAAVAPSELPVSAAPEVNPAGDIPDNQVFVAWEPPDKSFHVSVPEGWGRTNTGSMTVFTDKLNSITIESSALGIAPTTETESAAVTSEAGTSAGFSLGDSSTVDRAGGTAVLVTYSVDAPADPVTGKAVHDAVERYTFWQNGVAVTLTLSGPTGADNVDPWRVVTDSFGWAA